LFLFPIGTVIGIYGLWVLTKKESKDKKKIIKERSNTKSRAGNYR
jgi:hypothetical protein